MEKAIIKAIEGGYEYHCGKGLFTKGDGMKCTFGGANGDWTVWVREDNDSSICISHEDTLLDKDFWQALGKAEGWKENMPEVSSQKLSLAEIVIKYKKMPEWLYHWHKFIDALADGKSPNDFFKELLAGTDL